MSRPQRVRVIALARIRRPRDGALLVSLGHDATKEQDFHRLLGGGVDFGERGAAAVVRELAEEIGVEIVVDRFAGTIENLFTYGGEDGHELVLVYDAHLADPSLYERERFDGLEEDPVDAVWRPAAAAAPPLYPPLESLAP